MSSVLSSKTLWTGIALWSAFWVLPPFMEREYLFDLVNALLVSVGVGVIAGYLVPGVTDALTREKRDASDLLILGIACAWFATVGGIMMQWAWRYFELQWIIDHPLLAWFRWVLVTGGILHLSAKEAIQESKPPERWLRIGRWIAVGVLAAFVVIVWLEPFTH